MNSTTRQMGQASGVAVLGSLLVSTAQNDAAHTLLGTSVVINVLSNDSGGALSIVGYTMPTFGALALNPDQSFTYTPAADFVGSDNFTYTVRDGLGGTASAEVAITVARPNAAPNAPDTCALGKTLE